MKLTVNGKELTIEKSINLKDLLVVAKAEQPDYVTVELNGEFVDHSGFESTFVKDGDKTIKGLMAEIAKAANASIDVVRFARFERGEGIEKRKDDLAGEIAAMMK